MATQSTFMRNFLKKLRDTIDIWIGDGEDSNGKVGGKTIDHASIHKEERLKDTLDAGEELGRYRIEQKIGGGAMGDVYLAKDRHMGRLAAVKILKAKFVDDRDMVSRFQTEATAAASIMHPNIITIFDLGSRKTGRFTLPYLVMEYIDGKSLRDLIRSRELEQYEVLEIAIQICDGMRRIHAHEQHIIHRDLKPENILIDKSGRVKIVDFGLAKLKKEEESPGKTDSGITLPGVSMGTPAYMSPEQLESASSVDRRADIWAVGVIIYEMVTRECPFGKLLGEVASKIRNHEPEPMSTYKPGVSAGLQRMISKALSKKILARYQYMDDLLIDLKNEQTDLDETAELPRLQTEIRGARVPSSVGAESQLPSQFLESVEGAMSPTSRYYVDRDVDQIALDGIRSGNGVTITIKGPRQIGKSSLLVRTTAEAAKIGKSIAMLDFQQFDKSMFDDEATFFKQFCRALGYNLKIDDQVEKFWRLPLGNIMRCSSYIEDHILKTIEGDLVLALDEVDRVFATGFTDNFFGMLRAWHNSRQNPQKPVWKKLDLVLVTSTEPYQFIQNLNQSPFNVGQAVLLPDFTRKQAEALNSRYNNPLKASQVNRLYDLVGGHPYLVRKAYNVVASRQQTVEALFENAKDNLGPFGDHLRRIVYRLQGYPKLIDGLKRINRKWKCHDQTVFRRLEGAGLVRMDGQRQVVRCELYRQYFREHLSG